MRPVDSDDPATTVALPLDEDVPPLAAVRRWAAEALVGLTEDELDDCRLVITELVSNAYDHGVGPRAVRLRCSADRGVVRIEVDDASADDLTYGRSRLGPNRGRGLVIVDKLAGTWGVERHPGGKTVWAELPCGASHVPH
ncbi:anti-sigma regulatory factor (Ser/Thr protein kinase) [Saccharothrix carnea]|uniref:Anti-sigma regulatory factor (Ser/Thr protein kinase) n=1 Tax=Saccharothrix carnea TaxID=1280637 RepID=A0A2P8I0S6_SACCR|nr:ATP-binding protein [Saccharothrix carnea]PSL52052.1 anti-sigma regulatory factor (Ser/Thr protein kinase) [Saccharothrix carnea]